MKTKRTHFPIIAALTLAVIAAAVVIVLATSTSAAAAPWQQVSDDVEMAPLTFLPEAACETVGDVQTCSLWASAGSVSLPGGVVVPVWGFADSAGGIPQTPGPVIRAVLGQTLVINLVNNLAGEQVSLAFPGQTGFVPDLVGVPSGGTASYTLTPTGAGTFLYEAGLTEGGARQVAMGLFGPLVVVDPNAAPVAQEVVLVFSEVDPAFNNDPLNFSMINFQTRYWLINGQAFPQTGEIAVQPGSTVLLRLLNAGVETHPIGVLGLNQQIIAADGVALDLPYSVFSAAVASGQTKETLVAIPSGVDGLVYPLYDTGLHQHNNNQRIGRQTAFGGMLAFLRVSGEATPPSEGPVASSVAVTPSKTGGAVPVELSATFTDADGDVVAFEYFTDTLGPAGTGTLVSGFTPAPSVSVSTTISVEQLAALSGGQHTFYVRGQDSFGVWGTVGSAVLTLDKAGPTILGLGISPNPTNGTRDLFISGTADDRLNGSSIIIDAEYRMDGVTWVDMAFSPTGSTYAGLSATILAADVALLSEGSHSVEIRAQDEFFNWSDPYGTTLLTLDKTGPAVQSVNLVPNLIDLSQPLPSYVRLTASITDPLSSGVQSTLVKAEGFIDVAGPYDSGFSMYSSDGMFDEITEDVYYNIPGSSFSALTPGDHLVLVRGKDKAGNWGPTMAAVITIVAQVQDDTGPVVSNVVASPNPTAGANTVLLTATATDSLSNVAGAVWFQGTTPPRKLNYMTASDGAFDSLVENVQASISVKNWKVGDYLISVRAYDAAGNWGGIVTITLTVTK
jgi:FtsP/CotA-like multicopper oxidase with cupredoxin domain